MAAAGDRRRPSCRPRSTRIPPAQRDALASGRRSACAATTSASSRPAAALELPRGRRHAARPEGHAAGPRRHLRARRQGGLPVERADERDAGAGGRRRRDHHGGADAAAARRNALVLAAAARGRRRPRLHHRRRAGRGGAGLRHRDRAARSTRSPARATPTWPAPSGACSAQVGIDMIAGPERDPGAGRRQHAARLGGDGPVQPGRARRAGAEHPAVPGRRPTSTRCRRAIDRLLPGMPRARRHPRLARRPRRADPHAQHGRGLRDQQPHRARAPGGRPAATRTAGSRCSATPARSSSAPTPARAWATTAPARTTCCRPRGTARFSSPLGVYDFQKRSSLIEVSEAGAQALGPIAAELAYGEGLQAHARAAEMRLTRSQPMSRAGPHASA